MAKNKVRIRTYRHGLGDCHLVSFTKPDGSLFHTLIDCGVVDVTPDPETLMTGVARDIATEISGGNGKKAILDLVIATHQHTDHLSGFRQAKDEFAKIEMKRLWLAWTEDRIKGKKIKDQLGRGLAAVKEAYLKLQAAGSEVAPRVRGVLDFFGILGADGDKTQAILDSLQGREGVVIKLHEPGTVFLLPEVPNVRVYVLGPPEDIASLKITNPRQSKHEGYEDTNLAADASGFVDALLPPLDDEDEERSFPFDALYRRKQDEAAASPFFQKHYGFAKGEEAEWRRIAETWLESSEKLALALNSLTNNTSLALAFEFIDTGEVLLFPGDAQVGSWLSWQNLVWKVQDHTGAAKEVRIDDLLARTVFYKASHHASHNGTLSLLGLEKMNHRDLVVFVPVDKAMSKKKHWDRTLPWQPLLNRLGERSRGRMVLTDTSVTPPVAADLTDLTPAERMRFEKQVQFDPKKQWVDYVL
jgi:hypothetical protein